MKRPSRGAAIAGSVFLAAAIALGYAGAVLLARRYGGTVVQAKIDRCETPSAGRGGEVCQGTWTVSEAGRTTAIHGTVEGATFDDEGKQIEIVTTGHRGWTKRSASGVGYPALFFALLCLALAVILPWDSARRR